MNSGRIVAINIADRKVRGPNAPETTGDGISPTRQYSR
jgi:hypothetical protein